MAEQQARQELTIGEDYWLGTEGIVRTFIGDYDDQQFRRGEFQIIPRVYSFALMIEEAETSMSYAVLDGADLKVQHGRKILDLKNRKDFGFGCTTSRSVITQLAKAILGAKEDRRTVPVQRREITPITSLDEIGAVVKGDVIGIYCNGPAYPAMVLGLQGDDLELAYTPREHNRMAMQQQFKVSQMRVLAPGISVTHAVIPETLKHYKGNTELLRERGIFFREHFGE